MQFIFSAVALWFMSVLLPPSGFVDGVLRFAFDFDFEGLMSLLLGAACCLGGVIGKAGTS